MRILDRYTIREFTGPFLACVSGFTVMLLSGILFELIEMLVQGQLPPLDAGRLLIYKAPAIVALTLPAGALFAALLALGRFAKDSELTVMRVTGSAYWRLALPVIMIAAFISCITLWLNETVVPAANHQAETLFRQALVRDVIGHVEPNVFIKAPDDRVIYVGEVDRAHRRVKNVLVFEAARATRENPRPFPALITAREGTYADSVWHLENGVHRTLDAEGYVVQESGFQRMDIPMVAIDQLLAEQKTTDEMTRKELGEYIRLFQSSGIPVRRYEVDYHMKLALPMAALVWVLIAAPLACAAGRSGRFFGVFISILVAFAYYVTVGLASSLGGTGVLPPHIAAWLPNIVFSCLGLALMVRVEYN
ncbi:MAG TPA: YjgP/YjgQ family permease [Firmicutes bacterium]|jgi:lipopolysaccharide export system permease protein|nr:YjgP/YjgQ family permease [Bacillota bacterium]